MDYNPNVNFSTFSSPASHLANVCVKGGVPLRIFFRSWGAYDPNLTLTFFMFEKNNKLIKLDNVNEILFLLIFDRLRCKQYNLALFFFIFFFFKTIIIHVPYLNFSFYLFHFLFSF